MRALARLDRVDIEGLTLSLREAAASIRNVAQSEQLKSALVSLNDTFKSLQKTSRAAQRDLDSVDAGIKTVTGSLKKTSDQAGLALEQTQSTLLSLQQAVNPNSPAMYNLSLAAANLAQASRAVRDLANELQRNPSVLVRGRVQQDQSRF